MPAKNTIKTYVKDGFYHVYNRGVEKRKIFLSRKDYEVFLKYVAEHLSPIAKNKIAKQDFSVRGKVFKGQPRPVKNYAEEIDLIAYCLMPNHFHFLLKQKTDNSMERFVRSLLTRYSMFFNKKYERVGSLFQGPYKASLITEDQYLLHLSRYIHLNPSEYTHKLIEAFSSYSNFLGLKKDSWVKPDVVLRFFKDSFSKDLKRITFYKDFVERYEKEPTEILGNLILD
jgi:putative transposase